jgi:hypothetical protein
LITRIVKHPTKTLIGKPQAMASSPDGSDDKDCAKEDEYRPDEGWYNPWDA